MIMPAGRPLLLPVNPRFVLFSLLLALLLQMGLGLSQQAWLPDVLALTLAFWSAHQPRRVGMGLAFGLGLAIDVHESALLGQNALAYVLLAYGTQQLHRRLQEFSAWQQALQVAPIFILAAASEWLVRALAGAGAPAWSQLAAPVLQTLLWPLTNGLLLAPQRRAHDPDDIRPL